MEITSFSDKQKKAIAWWLDESPFSNRDFIIAEGAIRSGKTVALIESFLLWSLHNFTESNFIISGVSKSAINRNVMIPMFRLMEAKGIPYSWNQALCRLQVGGNIYYTFGANSRNSQDAVQGLTAAGFFADEVLLQPRSFVEQAMGRCSVDGSRYFFTLNPESPYHWFKEEMIDKVEDKNGLLMKFNMDDNPNLTEDVKRRYRNMYSGLFYKRYINGEWCVAEGAVYDMFDHHTHVIKADKSPTAYDKFIVGIDYGMATVMTFGLYGINGDNITLIKEYYYDAKQKQRQKTDHEFVEDFAHFVNGYEIDRIYIDPSAANFKRKLKGEGFVVKSAFNDVINGIRVTANKLSEGKFLIDESCKDCLREIQNYAWDQDAAEKGEDRPVKRDDHAMDRNRYVIYTYFKNPYAGRVLAKPRHL